MKSVIMKLAWIAWCVSLLVLSGEARAHDFNPGVLALIEVDEGRFDVVWTEPLDSLGVPGNVRITYPSHCALEGTLEGGKRLSCGRESLHGEIAFDGLRGARTKVVVSVQWKNQPAFDSIVTAESPRVHLHHTSSSAWRWIRLGMEHVLTGLDHVAFVIGLFLVVGPSRRLIATITAFTLAHSLTLALGALHILELARAPVEATIAASVVLVAREAMHREPTVTRAYPWAVAFVFGLVHGLGFAGALGEIGLPRNAFGVALASFNVGVELAQLAIVGVLVVVARLARTRMTEERGMLATKAAAYVIGASGAYWFFDRAYFVLNR